MKFRIGEGPRAPRIPFSLPRRKRNPSNGDGELGSNRDSLGSDAGFRSVDSGSKDDAFFESRPWLDSDCEDDFFSVNGDFTPSRGSTPNHRLATPRRSQASKSSPLGFTPNSQPESSPNHEKQKLSELLRENQEGGVEMESHNLNTNTGASRDASSNVETKRAKEREFKSMQCCLPNFVRSLSSRERRKPKTNPAQ